MTSRVSAFLVALLAYGVLSAGVMADDTENEASKLKFKSYKKWKIVMPKETFVRISGGIKIPHAGGKSFVTEIQGTALAIDTNADGKVDSWAKGTAGYATLKGRTTKGTPLRYAVRLRNAGGWQYSSSGVMEGRVRGTVIRLIDQNNNGRYNDYGQDAMIVGKGSTASFLSRVVSLGGSLYNVEVSEDGATATTTPFDGESGTINLRGQFQSKGGKLVSAIIANTQGDVSFDVSSRKNGLAVPVGEYKLAFALATKGTETVKVRQGAMKPFLVTAEQNTAVKWGGPLRAEFKYTHKDGLLTIQPTDLSYYGRSGEEYYDWFPDGKPPKFVVRDVDSRREITTIRFGGC